MENHVLQNEGYHVVWTEFLKGVAAEAAAMVGGSIDIGWVNTSASITAFSKDPGLAYLIGQSITNDNMIVVPEGSPITSVSQLAGKTISCNGPVTSPVLVLDMAMTKAGANPTTVNCISSPGPQQVPVMQQKSVAAAATYLPFAAQMVLNGGRILVTANQALGTAFPGGGFVATTAFAKAHPGAVVAFLKAAISAESQLEKKTAADYKTLASFDNTSTQAISYSFHHHLVAFAPMVPNMAALTTVAKAEMKYGFVSKGTNLLSFIKTFVDPTFAQQASR